MLLLLVVLSYLSRQTGPLQDITRKRKRGVVVPLSCESRQATDKGHTGRDSCPSPGEGVAQGGRVQPREDKGPPRWCDCVQDFLVNFNVCDRGSPWSLPQPSSCVCGQSDGGSRTVTAVLTSRAAMVSVPVSYTHTPTHTQDNDCPALPFACPLFCSVWRCDNYCLSSLQAVPPRDLRQIHSAQFYSITIIVLFIILTIRRL